MTLDLTRSADEQLVEQAIGEVLAREGGVGLRRDPEVAASGVSRPLWKVVSDLGYGTLAAPDSGVDLGVAAAGHRAYGRVLAPLPLLVGGLIAPTLVPGVPELATASLAQLFNPSTLGDPVTGTVRGVPYGLVARVLVVRTAHGVAALDLTDPGIDRQATPDLAHQGLATVHCAQTPALATGPAPDDRLEATARVLLAAYALGAAEAALDLSVDYAKERRQFGVPIGSFQAIQHRLADVAAAVQSADLLVGRAAWAVTTDQPAAPTAVLVAWRAATGAAVTASRAAVQVFGGYGFTLEYDAQFFYRVAKAIEVAFGPDRGLSARQLAALRDGGDDSFL